MKKLKISLFFYEWNNNVEYINFDVDRIYLPFQALLDENVRYSIETYRKKGREIFVWIPSITRGNYDKLIKLKLEEVAKSGVDGVLIGNIGSLKYLNEISGLKVMGDYTLNAFNSSSIEELAGLGLDGITLSLELTLGQINSLENINGLIKEALVYGGITLMTSEYCPVGSIAGGFSIKSKCNDACKKGAYLLRDRMGIEFPVLCDKIDCRSSILNSNKLFIPDSLDRLKTSGVDMVRLNITDEEPEEIEGILGMYKDIIENSINVIDEYEDISSMVKAKGFTKGHYFRGV